MGLGRSCDSLVAVFDVTNSASLEALEPFAAQLIRARPDTARLLLGTKCDGDGRQVTRAEGEGAAQRLGMRYFEASASTGSGVREVFEVGVRLARECSQRRREMVAESGHVTTMIHRTSGFGSRPALPVPATAAACCSLV
jgi:hypothetical protein